MRLIQITCLFMVVFGCSTPEAPKIYDSPEVINPGLDFRPNILWLVAEDLSPVLPAYGDSTIETVILDRLAAEGVVYDNFFSPHPVCAPARAAIITGMYANHIGASHMRTGPWYSDEINPEVLLRAGETLPEGISPYEAIPPSDVRMFTEYLRLAGYYTTNNAKQDYQFRKTPTAWDESSQNAHWRNRAAGQPFFAVFNFNVTHESRIWAKAGDSLWVDDQLDVPVPPYLPDTEVGRTDIRRMYSNILEMDRQVGKILEELEADGLLDSTLVIWYSDHGGPLPRQKRLLFDSGIKVPMIIRFPNGLHAGERDERMISFIDLAPTMLSIAGISPPSYMEGGAFLGEYARPVAPFYVFGAADRFDEKQDRIRSVRDERFKYIRYYQPDKPMFLNVAYRNQMPIMQELLRLQKEGGLTESQALWFRQTKPREELFDTFEDPHEVNNLSEDPRFEAERNRLSAVLDGWVDPDTDTGIGDERELINRLWPENTQPVTATPEVHFSEGVASIMCATTGASIGFKVLSDTTNHEAIPWMIYDKPVPLNKGDKILTVGHRIGFLRSRLKMFQN